MFSHRTRRFRARRDRGSVQEHSRTHLEQLLGNINFHDFHDFRDFSDFGYLSAQISGWFDRPP